jgi:EmrB/QacA subfamily drug resistance transporter
MVNIALPAIGRGLGVEPARLGWVITGYLLVFGVSVPFYGRLGDVLGARRLFVIGICVYSASSLLCALSVSYPMLLAGRVLQAAGAAAIPGLGMAIITGVYPPERRGSALGFVSATIGTGAAVGPSVGGAISDLLDWHYMFLLTALVGLLVPVALRILPPGERRAGEGMDLLGGLLVALSVGGALLAATEGARGGLLAPVVVGAAATSLLAAVLLVQRQRRARFPFIPRELLRNGGFLALVGVSFGAMTANMATFVALPLLLTSVHSLSLVQIGLALLPNALALAVLGPIAGRVVDRIGGRLPVRGGLLGILGVVLAYSAFGASAPVWGVALLAGVQGAAFAFLNAPLNTMVSLAAGKERQSSGLGINSMAFFLGGGFGTALLTAVLTLRDGARDALNPLYSGEAVAYSDAFLLFAAPLIVAVSLSLLLPGADRASDQPGPVSSPRPASAGAQR